MKHLNAVIFGIAMVVSAYFLGNAYSERANPPQHISITGLGTENFSSDLIVWEGRFSTFNTNLKQAFEALKKDKELVKDYLTKKGIAEENIIFKAVQTIEQRDNRYENGNFVGSD
ncbi:SIMPL domain-containing protein, partial [Eudoraea sp.]